MRTTLTDTLDMFEQSPQLFYALAAADIVSIALAAWAFGLL